MTDLRDIYQEVILEHAKAPRNFRELPASDCKAEGFNPLCGDRCSISVAMDGEVIKEIGFQGSGCAISRASASMMTQAVKGKTAEQAEELFHHFQRLVTGQDDHENNQSGMGKLEVFAGVSGFPARVKCATLPWHTMRAALRGEREPITTE